MKVGSLFTGVGGFDLGLERAGMEIAWQVEADPEARSVLRRHYSDIPIYEDVRNVGSNLDDVDLVCGGFPCQDVSVAGNRAGLAGERSGLFYEAARIIDTIAPRFVLIENVPGLLSSNGGRDMGAVLGTLANLGYGYTYRVLDSQNFGVPQRRRRVFIVADSRGFCEPEILLEREGVPGYSSEGEEAREDSPAFTPSSFGQYRRGVGTLRAMDIDTGGGNHVVLNTPLAVHDKVVCIQGGEENGSKQQGGPGIDEGTMYTLTCREIHGIFSPSVIGKTVSPTGRQGDEFAVDLSPSLSAHNGPGRPYVLPTLTAHYYKGPGHNRDRLHVVDNPYSITERFGGKIKIDRDSHPTLTCGGGKPGQGYPNVFGAGAPRKLTPVEFERLQGFPDGWTEKSDAGEEISDTARYRFMGNAVTVPVAEWIGERILRYGSIVDHPSGD